jgi:hypothetical protein
MQGKRALFTMKYILSPIMLHKILLRYKILQNHSDLWKKCFRAQNFLQITIKMFKLNIQINSTTKPKIML